jgi:adenosine deaminase CECR1
MQGFQNLVDDGIYHYELRALGFSADDYMNLLNLLAKFNSNRTETEKLTIRFIVCDIRNVSVESSFATMKNMIDLRAANSTLRTMLVGYDVVGEEDLLNRLEFYVPAILKARTYAASLNQSVDMFPHCGETANVTHAGSNLFDGVLLSSKRLGHAIGLRDHPLLQTIVNDTQIGLELCPISNQLLRYVSDFRLHPGASYVASGLPVTLSTDDSTIYGLKSAAPSYEFFLAFATWDLTLSSVKAIAQNSIIYSALDSASKTAKLSAFDVKWNEWLDMVLNASFVSRL